MDTLNNCNIGSALRALSGYGRLTPWHGIVYSRSYDAAKPHKNSLSNHWSSTENSTNNSWNMNFNDGNANNNNKYNTNVVRPSVAHPTKAWLELRKTIQEAYIDCCRGKRNGRQYQDYLSIANEDLDLLTTELMEGTYKPSTSTCFLVKFPKLREVFAAAFRDRIIHHWMCLRLGPLFEALNRSIGDVTHNCRVGYGTKSAVDKVFSSIKAITYHYGVEAYVFRGDLVGFFMSLPQRCMCDKLKELTSDEYHGDFKELLIWLIEIVVMHRPEMNCMLNSNPEDWIGLTTNKSLYRTEKGCGAPIGNLTTQLFANFYMAEFDSYMMRKIAKLKKRGIKASYNRFVDDFVLVCNNAKALKWLVKCAEEKLTEMKLTMHKNKRYIQPASHGILFVGSYIKNGRIYLSNRTIGRFKDKVKQIYDYFNNPSVQVTSADLDHILATLNSYLGFCADKRTFRLRRRIMRPLKYLPAFCKYYSVNDQTTKVTLKKEAQNYYYIKSFTMTQICKFSTKPATIVDGGYKKGQYIVWLNLSVSENQDTEVNPLDKFESVTDRLVLSSHSIISFIEAVEDKHLAIASNEEIAAILTYFQMESDIESWKAIRQKQIRGYDQTEKVNCFYLAGQPLWLDKATRVGLVNSVSAEKRDGCTITDLWFGNIMIQLPVDDALSKLDKIELYAKQCYNVTARHIADIEKINSIEELRDYDITSDYPPFLELNITE